MSAVLAGIDEAGGFDARECGGFVGTSAGSIVATALAGGVAPASRLGSSPARPAVDDDEAGPSGVSRAIGAAAMLGGVAAAPLASLALRSAQRPGAMVRRAALARVPAGRRSLAELGRTIDRMGLAFDGRLLVAAVELESGRRVLFGEPGAPRASVAQAVQASCAIPGVFRPVPIDGRTYVDGGAWSPTNIDGATVASGQRVLCLNPTGSMRPNAAQPAGALGPVSRSIAAAEALALRQRGARVRTVNPDRDSAAAMGVDLMSPSGRSKVIAAGLAQGRRLGRG